MGLFVTSIKEKTRLDDCLIRNTNLGIEQQKTQVKLKSARAENWVWRIGGALAVLKLGVTLIQALKP
jgi:hypothetical protein